MILHGGVGGRRGPDVAKFKNPRLDSKPDARRMRFRWGLVWPGWPIPKPSETNHNKKLEMKQSAAAPHVRRQQEANELLRLETSKTGPECADVDGLVSPPPALVLDACTSGRGPFCRTGH